MLCEYPFSLHYLSSLSIENSMNRFDLICLFIWFFQLLLLGLQACCNSKSQTWFISPNEIGLQSICSTLSIFYAMGGFFMHLYTSQIPKYLPHTCLQGWFLFSWLVQCWVICWRCGFVFLFIYIYLSLSLFCHMMSVIGFVQVYTDGRPNISTHGRKATIKDFYGTCLPNKSLFWSLVFKIVLYFHLQNCFQGLKLGGYGFSAVETLYIHPWL